MSLAHAEALCDAVRRRWPSARVAPGQVTGEGKETAVVLCDPRRCPDCGTEVVAMRRPGRADGRWYQLGGHAVKPNGWSRVSFMAHNADRCRAALAGRGLVLPETSAGDVLLGRATEEPE